MYQIDDITNMHGKELVTDSSLLYFLIFIVIPRPVFTKMCHIISFLNPVHKEVMLRKRIIRSNIIKNIRVRKV